MYGVVRDAMKLLPALSILIAYVSLADADIYMHCPRGSNNRMNEATATRNNANRVFDSQNNNRGGYNIGDKTDQKAGNDYNKQYRMHYIMSPLDETKGESVFPIEWTNQHGCGENEDSNPNKCNSNMVLQMKCEPHDDTDPAPQKTTMRDGTTTNTQDYNNPNNNENEQQYAQRKNNNVKTDRAYHEPHEWYDKCTKRKRNHGLFIADQKLNGHTSKHTRQNPNGQRRGYECPEERDYFPYWHPTPWKDIKVLAERTDRCAFYKKHSFNTKSKWECVEKWPNSQKDKHYSEHNNKIDCEANAGVWTEFHNYLEILPLNEAECNAKNQSEFVNKLIWGRPIFEDTKKCLVRLPEIECDRMDFSRVNHLGNGKDLEPLSIKWKIPAFPSGNSQKCVLRMRYNISTDDYNVENATLPKELIKTFTGKAESKIMGRYGGLPQTHSHGKFYLGTVDKPSFKAGEYITYEKTRNGNAPFQWFGWQSRIFSEKYITFKFAINFEGSVPPKSNNLGFKVYGKVYDNWISTCQADQWCYVEETVKVAKSGDGDHVILIFDSVADQRKIHFADITVDVFEFGDLITQNPTLDIGALGQGIKLAINTAQFGRTFQDRSHVSILQKRDEIFNGNTLHTVQVRGKRGNIVQTFPAVEYDFIPTNLKMKSDDMVLFTWTGSNSHNNGGNGGDGQAGDDGQGTGGTDRSNVCGLQQRDQVYPLPVDDKDNLCQNIEKIMWSKHAVHPTDAEAAKLDACIQLMSSGHFKCFKKHSTCQESLINSTKEPMDPILNNSPASFEGIVLKLRPGTHHYFSTRNNAFTNRAQKASVFVEAPAK